MPGRIRGQETTLGVVINDVLQFGSFTKIESWSVTPRTDLTESDFIGETESEPDVMHHGFDFTFVTHEMENAPVSYVKTLVAANATGQPMPNVRVVIVKKYRDPSIPSVTMTLSGSLRLKLDKHESSDRKGYIKNTWSGKCRYMK
jgi:hypothetical protein